MRLKRYHNFKLNEALDEKYITEDELEYALQGIRDIDDDITDVDVSFKLIKELDGVQKDSQYVMNFPGHQDKETELKYDFYDSVVPGTEGYIAYEVTITYDYISKSKPSDTFIISDDDFDLSEEMESEVNRFIKRVRADFKVNLLDWYIKDTSNLSSDIHPVITVYFYKPFQIKITVEDFVKFYDITNYVVENNKLYMDVLLSDVVPVFIKDDKQEEWLCKRVIDDDYFWDYTTSASDVEYALNKEHTEMLIKYFADTYFDGSIEALNEEFDSDFEKMLEEYSSSGDSNVEVLFDTYRNMYCDSLQNKHTEELETEFFRYIEKNYSLNGRIIEKDIEQTIEVKYKTKDDNGKLIDKWHKETVYTDKYRFEFDFDSLKYYDMDRIKGDGLSLWEVWREANDPERTTLEPYYSDHGDVNYPDFNTEIAYIFKE
jgi:hypothetical protein